MVSGDKFYLIENLDNYAVIINERLMNNIPHYNLVIHWGQSERKTYLSKVALEVFYQKQPRKKNNFFNILGWRNHSFYIFQIKEIKHQYTFRLPLSIITLLLKYQKVFY